MKYVIINYIDRPDETHVAEKLCGKYYYMSRAFLPHMRVYDKMIAWNATSMHQFGFEIIETQYDVKFKQILASAAIYKDGRNRLWQGKTDFILPKVKLNNIK